MVVLLLVFGVGAVVVVGDVAVVVGVDVVGVGVLYCVCKRVQCHGICNNKWFNLGGEAFTTV